MRTILMAIMVVVWCQVCGRGRGPAGRAHAPGAQDGAQGD